jgi:hypothetical protein
MAFRWLHSFVFLLLPLFEDQTRIVPRVQYARSRTKAPVNVTAVRPINLTVRRQEQFCLDYPWKGTKQARAAVKMPNHLAQLRQSVTTDKGPLLRVQW